VCLSSGLVPEYLDSLASPQDPFKLTMYFFFFFAVPYLVVLKELQGFLQRVLYPAEAIPPKHLDLCPNFVATLLSCNVDDE